jgi:hypothetical protein
MVARQWRHRYSQKKGLLLGETGGGRTRHKNVGATKEQTHGAGDRINLFNLSESSTKYSMDVHTYIQGSLRVLLVNMDANRQGQDAKQTNLTEPHGDDPSGRTSGSPPRQHRSVVNVSPCLTGRQPDMQIPKSNHGKAHADKRKRGSVCGLSAKRLGPKTRRRRKDEGVVENASEQ